MFVCALCLYKGENTVMIINIFFFSVGYTSIDSTKVCIELVGCCPEDF